MKEEFLFSILSTAKLEEHPEKNATPFETLYTK